LGGFQIDPPPVEFRSQPQTPHASHSRPDPHSTAHASRCGLLPLPPVGVGSEQSGDLS